MNIQEAKPLKILTKSHLETLDFYKLLEAIGNEKVAIIVYVAHIPCKNVQQI